MLGRDKAKPGLGLPPPGAALAGSPLVSSGNLGHIAGPGPQDYLGIIWGLSGNYLGFLFGSQRRWSLSLLVLTLIFPALLPCLVRDSLCTALQTKILWINRSLNAIDTIETWVSGNLTALTERSQPAIRWRVGEVANRVSGGSFRGGH